MTTIDEATCRRLVDRARVGRLATVTAGGRPHVVPCCFALVGGTICSAVDAKPKSTVRLARLDNVRANPEAALLVDRYDDDWSRLWWVRVDGPARVIEQVDEHELAVDALVAKYEQYRADRPTGPVLAIDARRWTGWAFSPDEPER